MGPKIKFFYDGVLRIWNWGDFLRRDNEYNAIDRDGEIFVPRVPMGVGDLNLEDKIWVKVIAPDEHEVYLGDVLMFKYNAENGNLIFGFNDLDIVPVEKGGTGVQSLEEVITWLELKGGAFRDVGAAANQLIALNAEAKLPPLDGSLLTNLPTLNSGVVAYFASETPPTGFLEANGSLLLRADYPALFDRIGTRWGAGDGSTSFRIPDLRGVFIRGWDNGRGIDPTRAFGDLQNDAMQNITGTIAGVVMGDWGITGSGAFQHLGTYGIGRSSSGQYAHSLSFDASRVARTAAETRPTNVSLLPCIKY